MAEQLSLQINIGGKEQVLTSFGEIKKAIKDAEFQALSLSEKFGASDKRVLQLRQQIGTLKDTIEDSAAATKNYAGASAIFPAIAKSVQGVASGLTAVQGAIGLLGVESKEVEKTLLKVQSAMALSQGLGDLIEAENAFINLGGAIKSTTAFKIIDNATTKVASVTMKLFGVAVETTSTSFKILKGAIAATGIGLLVVALGYVIEKLITFSNASDKAAQKQKELNKQFAEGAKQGLKDNEKFIDSDIKLKIARAKARGASEKELLDIEQQGIKDKIALRQRAYETALKTDKELASNIAEQNSDAQDQLLINDLNFQANKLKEQQDANKNQLEENKKNNDEILKQNEDARQEALKLEQERRDDVKSIEGEINAIKQETARVGLSEKDAAILEAQQELDNNLALYKDNLDAKQKAYILYDAKIKLIESNAKVETKKVTDKETEDWYKNLAARAHIQIGTIVGEQKIKEKKSDDDKKLQKAEREAQIALAAQTLDILSGLVDKNSVAGKAIAISQAIINTYQGASKALAQGGIFGPVAAAATIAAGLINVKKIISTKVPSAKGGGDVGGGGGVPSISSAAPMTAIGAETATTNISQQSINALGNQAMRAYVVETDVTSSQQRIAAIQQRARFN